MAINFPDDVGLYEPQLLGHALILCGLALVARRGGSRRDALAASFLMVLGLFTKHHLLAIPLATMLWLSWTDRRRAVAFGLSGVAFGMLGLLVCLACFGTPFWHGMLSPRAYVPAKAWHELLGLAPTLKLLTLLASPVLVLARRDRWSLFLALLVAAALLIGTAASLGDGVADNVFYDLLIADALSLGHLLARAASLGPRLAAPARSWLVLAAALGCFWSDGFTSLKDVLLIAPWRSEQMRRAAEVESIVAALAAKPGPAVCQQALYCYWAGKPFVYDDFHVWQMLRTHQIDEAELVRRLDDDRIQSYLLNGPRQNEMLPPALLAAVHADYSVALVTKSRTLYVRTAR
jgi:hypothetical protein